MILLAALVVCAIIDARTQKIPNDITLPLMLLGLAAQAAVGDGIMGASPAWEPLRGALPCGSSRSRGRVTPSS